MSKDLSLVYSRLFSMLAWQIATAPLFLILVAQFNSLCADGSSPYSCPPTPPPFLMEYNIFFPWLDFWRHWGYFANSQTIPNWSVPLRIQCFKRCSHEKQMRCWFKTGGLKSEGFVFGLASCFKVVFILLAKCLGNWIRQPKDGEVWISWDAEATLPAAWCLRILQAWFSVSKRS